MYNHPPTRSSVDDSPNVVGGTRHTDLRISLTPTVDVRVREPRDSQYRNRDRSGETGLSYLASFFPLNGSTKETHYDKNNLKKGSSGTDRKSQVFILYIGLNAQNSDSLIDKKETRVTTGSNLTKNQSFCLLIDL